MGRFRVLNVAGCGGVSQKGIIIALRGRKTLTDKNITNRVLGHQLGDMMVDATRRWRVSHRFGGAPEVTEEIEIMFSCRKFSKPP